MLHVDPPCFPRDRALEAVSECAHSRHSHVAASSAVSRRLEHGAFGCNATAFATKSEIDNRQQCFAQLRVAWRLQRDNCRVIVHRRRNCSLVVCGSSMLVLRIDDITPGAAFGVSTKLLIIGAIRICPGPVVPTTGRVAGAHALWHLALP
jgi:hypothetical protein